MSYEARSAIALERIADTLDDYMEMSLALNELTDALRGSDPQRAALLTDVIGEIKNQRDYRQYEP